ncbi:Hypothetical protein, putative [Bodo saltans]|uniref:Uncharacterized protein n=1 Tax=Bodo saltans TaxID=75058 RepID=A0A0S4JMI8_BODSA|nr:Hypothetical protein, putative [Bodo saltans]|eukprot:CUG90494.1 Hypothetical protein, putative [Bodo saltans]
MSTEKAILQRVLAYPLRPAKLFVGIGSDNYLHARDTVTAASLPRTVGHALLKKCRVPAPDIHDPTNMSQRSRHRDASGKNRALSYTLSKNGPRKHIQHDSWDTAPFCDVGGLWCDRLLLGEPMVRSALLLPYSLLAKESLRRVADSHPYLVTGPESTLLIASTDRLDAMKLHMEPIGGPLMETLLPSHQGVQDCVDVLDQRHQRGDEIDVLWIGTGSDTPLLAPMDAASVRKFEDDVVPVATFFAAMWASSPPQAKDMLNDGRWRQWSLEQRKRILSSMQQSMISTRDEHVLKCYSGGVAVSPRLNRNATIYEAGKVLERMETEEAEARRGRRGAATA